MGTESSRRTEHTGGIASGRELGGSGPYCSDGPPPAAVIIASQRDALRQTETLLALVDDAIAELAAAHSPNVRRLCHAAERTRRLLRRQLSA